MRVNIYIRKENEDAWERSKKSKWINSLLEGEKPVKMPVRCSGAHYMDRTNCGKEGCPWNAKVAEL